MHCKRVTIVLHVFQVGWSCVCIKAEKETNERGKVEVARNRINMGAGLGDLEDVSLKQGEEDNLRPYFKVWRDGRENKVLEAGILHKRWEQFILLKLWPGSSVLGCHWY